MQTFSLNTYGTKVDDISLVVNYQGIRVVLSPEFPQQIWDLDVDAENGIFNTNPSNGSFMFSWSPVEITFQVARHGDGLGGSIDITIPSTPELLMELHTVLHEWGNYVPPKPPEGEP
jgi:hypothetical protein